MYEETMNCVNMDVQLMNPCYSRDDDNDIAPELYCSDFVIDTYADGYYYAIKGWLEDAFERIDEFAENPLGEFPHDTGCIGVPNYWIGKEKVVNYHLEVPFYTLEHQHGFSRERGVEKEEAQKGAVGLKDVSLSKNMIIHGDNLLALKALMPEYVCKQCDLELEGRLH